MDWHLACLLSAIGGLVLSVRLSVAWLASMFGTVTVSRRAFRLLKRPPLADSAPPRPPSVDATWRKSTLTQGTCSSVEIAYLADGSIGVRDSKDADGPILCYTPSEWEAFLAGAKNGEFDDLAQGAVLRA
jgi:hypothetical protein